MKSGVLEVGNCLNIYVHPSTGFAPKKLSDGVVVTPGDLVGEIELKLDNLPLDHNGGVVIYGRALFRSITQSLGELAKLCEVNDPLLEGVVGFHGISHLAGPLAGKMGFDVFLVSDISEFFAHTVFANMIVRQHAGKNTDWRKFKPHIRIPKEVYISRNSLVSRYVRE
jgi:hypothetical protein